jgi:uncharacterized protein YecA (UPF0149 family)
MLKKTRNLKREFKRGRRQITDIIEEKTTESWQGETMHGQFARNKDEKLQRSIISMVETRRRQWETGSTILTAQEQAVSKNYFKNKIRITIRNVKTHTQTTM